TRSAQCAYGPRAETQARGQSDGVGVAPAEPPPAPRRTCWLALHGGGLMRVLLVHPSPLLFSEIYLRLEPLALERVAAAGEAAGPPPLLVPDLAGYPPARHLAGRRRRYFIGELAPCASVEFTRGCPWDCTFCSAWTFYGRSYRVLSPEAAAEDLASVREPNVFIVDDVAFIRGEDGFAIADEVERRNVRKRYYLETRADVL